MRDQDFFWEGVKNNQLLIQQCADCNTLRQPPGPMCPLCQSLHWRPQQASGKGSVYAWIASQHPTELDEAPRIVALIDLAEGVRMVSNLQDVRLGDVYEGLPVEVFFDSTYGLPQFRPSESTR
jgi:hypothetical protein